MLFHFMKLPNELQIRIFEALPDHNTAGRLRLVCKHANSIYRMNENSITKRIDSNISARAIELANIVNVYYDFLVGLCIEESDVLRPPCGGWPSLRDADPLIWKRSRFALDVLSQLNYLKPTDGDYWEHNRNMIDYKSDVVDYSSMAIYEDDFTHEDYFRDYLEIYRSPGACKVAVSAQDFVLLSRGCEGGGVMIYLDTKDWIIYEDILGDSCDVYRVEDYFESQKQMRRDCEHLPVYDQNGNWWSINREVREAYDPQLVEEQGEPVLKERLGNAEDQMWILHLYKKHGWPDGNWRKQECLDEVQRFVKRKIPC